MNRIATRTLESVKNVSIIFTRILKLKCVLNNVPKDTSTDRLNAKFVLYIVRHVNQILNVQNVRKVK